VASVADGLAPRPSQGALFSFDSDQCERCPFAPHFGGLCPGAGSEFACNPRTLNPAHPFFAELIGELGGSDFGLTHALRQSRIVLPPAIPQTDGILGRTLDRPWKAVRLEDFWKRTRRSTATTLREALAADPCTKILLLLNARDDTLDERIWHPRHRFVRSLEFWRPDAVAGPSYSVWDGDPWLEREYSILKSLRLFGLFQEHGILAIPNVYWGDHGQMARWISWLNDNPVVEIITMDLQALGAAVEPGFIPELRTFRSALTCPPWLLVSGVAREGFVRNLQSVWPNSSFTANNFILAYKRRETLPQPNGATTRRVVRGGEPEILHRLEFERLEAIVSEPLRLWRDLEFGSVRAPAWSLPYEADGLWAGLPREQRHGGWMPRTRRRIVKSEPLVTPGERASTR
jgi:hypothetical protein